VNTEERKLSEILHRHTPEPQRPVTVEQVAYRLVSDPQLARPGGVGGGGRGRGRGQGSAGPRPRRGGLVFGRALAPALAAAAVIVVAGASAGIAVLASHHSSPPPVAAPASSDATSNSASASASASSSPTQQTSSPAGQLIPGTRIAGGPWGAEQLDQDTFNQGSLVSADGALYAIAPGSLVRINPATGTITASAQYNPAVPNPPVVVGDTVWVVWSYSGGNIVLHGFNAKTLALVKTLPVTAIGAVSGSASNVLASGPDGNLYVAAGVTAVGVNPDSGQVVKRVSLTAGTADAVAVSPDGSQLYVGIGTKVLIYDLSSQTEAGSSSLPPGQTVGNLVATSGGLWGTTGTGLSEFTWFAPGGNLSKATRVGAGAGGGYASLPSYSDGVIWVGGSHTLSCANPDTGQVRDTATLPTDHSVVEYFSSPVISGGRAYSYYSDDASQRAGLVRMTPPAACTGGGVSS
jgi:hypothetical protein